MENRNSKRFFRRGSRKIVTANVELSANELANAIYNIVSENSGVSLSANNQERIDKVLDEYYNIGSTSLAFAD